MRWWLFQSTLPARGATVRARYVWRSCADFNPRSPHGERLTSRCKMAGRCEFQSTLPARGATAALSAVFSGVSISIHAPRTGSDPQIAAKFHRKLYFNPRSPHGERPSRRTSTRKQFLFQSTLPARGATKEATAVYINEEISIHAPRTGSDAKLSLLATFLPDFNPRSPHGERHRINMIA